MSLPAPLYDFSILSEMNRVRVSLAVSGYPRARRGATLLQVRPCRRPRPTRPDLERLTGARSLAARQEAAKQAVQSHESIQPANLLADTVGTQ